MRYARPLILALTLLLALGALAGSQDKPDARDKPAPVTWRTVKPDRDWMVRRLTSENSGTYKVGASELVHEFSRRAKVSVRCDHRQLNSLGTLEISGGEQALSRALFDLCQAALSRNSLTLLPEDAACENFVVEGLSRVVEFAPVVEEKDLGQLAALEWASLTVRIDGARPSDVLAAARAVMSKRGGSVQLLGDSAALIAVDTAANLQRIVKLARQADGLSSKPPDLVTYQRACKVNVESLYRTFVAHLERTAEREGYAARALALEYDPSAQLLSGTVTRELASFLDGGVDAAEAAAKARAAAREEEDRTFIQFSHDVPQGEKALHYEGALRLLLQPEYGAGDVRSVVRSDVENRLFIRCRPWIEKDVREALEMLAKK